MVKITDIQPNTDFSILIEFDDGKKKIIDFKPFIKDDPLTNQLSDPEYFRQVRIYENGRGIFWPNSYDFCPDYLRYFLDPS